MGALFYFILLLLFPVIGVLIIVIATFVRPKNKRQVDWKRAVALQNATRQAARSMDDWRQEPWRAFAEVNGLKLAQAALSNDVRISGEYRGHHLVLEVHVVPEIPVLADTTTIRAVLDAHASEKRTEALMR